MEPAEKFEIFFLEMDYWCDKEVIDSVQHLTLEEGYPIIMKNMNRNKAKAWVKSHPWYLRPFAREQVKKYL